MKLENTLETTIRPAYALMDTQNDRESLNLIVNSLYYTFDTNFKLKKHQSLVNGAAETLKNNLKKGQITKLKGIFNKTINALLKESSSNQKINNRIQRYKKAYYGLFSK